MNDREIAQKLATEQSALQVTIEMRRKLNLRRATPRRRAVPRRFAVIAFALVLVTACAYATGLHRGIVDFVNRLQGRRLPDNVNQYITENAMALGDADGTFSVQVRQTAFDGRTIFAVMDIVPSDQATILTAPDTLIDDPASNLGLEWNGTLQEYCEQKGYTEAWSVSASWQSEWPDKSKSIDGIWCEDGFYTQYVVISLAQPVDHVEGTLGICLTRAKDQKRMDIPCTLSLTSAAEARILRKNLALPVEGAGITIDCVEIDKRAFETWVSIFYTVTDAETYGQYPMGVDFRLWENGKTLPMGASGLGVTEVLRGKAGSVGVMYRARQSTYMSNMPQVMEIEVFLPGESVTLDRFSVEFE